MMQVVEPARHRRINVSMAVVCLLIFVNGSFGQQAHKTRAATATSDDIRPFAVVYVLDHSGSMRRDLKTGKRSQDLPKGKCEPRWRRLKEILLKEVKGYPLEVAPNLSPPLICWSVCLVGRH
jgi:hypothetical protein